MKTWITVLAALAGTAGLIATIVSAWGTSAGLAVLIVGVIGIILLGVQVYLDIWGKSRKFRRFRNQDAPEGRRAVKVYMDQLLSKGENVAIFTRDMSWVDGDTEVLLTQKAKKNNLTVFMLKANDLSARLSTAGAEIYYYETITGDRPIMSRFTLINLGRSQAELAIGHRDEDVHTIEMFSNPREYALTLAQDMFLLLKDTFAILDKAQTLPSVPHVREGTGNLAPSEASN
ncbi:hypothetical protein [Arthrobacter sp. Alg241-R88]|uniref:hypothetical protein n=1 Tax=Arthrobacter sp. Alg241-R88 TaxID=2305984 RepID=UPI0013D2D660|nr:hypothetical protein [Arthrobacter sp. Alg241-R88]